MVNNSAGAASTSTGKGEAVTGGGNTMDEKAMPKDARVMISILKDMGIMEFEPRVVNQLLEFSYRYISTVLEDSKVLSAHARKKAIDMDDVKLAVEMHTDHNLTCPPPRDLLLEVAAKRNAVPLPIPRQTGGLRLPPDRFCLTATNYRLKPNKKRGPGSKSQVVGSSQGGYGANYGINSMNTIPQAMKSQVNPAGKISLNTGSISQGGASTFSIKQLPQKVGNIGGTSSANTSTTGTSGQPAAFIKINHPGSTAGTVNQTSQLNTAAKIQIQAGVSTTSSSPIFSMTVNPLHNSTTTGVKRKAEQMENHK